MTQPLTTTDLEELLEEEVPCQDCGREAVLRSMGHTGCSAVPPLFRCIPCWQKWLQGVLSHIQFRGDTGCSHCPQRFYSVEAFSDYRPF
jgi:DNA-directed RNA polymerase subunit RPC12/RpoP